MTEFLATARAYPGQRLQMRFYHHLRMRPNGHQKRKIDPMALPVLTGEALPLPVSSPHLLTIRLRRFIFEVMIKPRKKAIVLLSGGLDSATALAIAVKNGFAPYALSFQYGQRHLGEIAAAKNIAARAGVEEHQVMTFDLRAFGGSALTADIAVPKERSPDQIGTGIPVTYVPARNTIFLSFALGWAEVLPALDIFVGVNALDFSGYPDCRPEFIAAFERLANTATRAGTERGEHFTIHAPLLHWSKAEIIRQGLQLNVDYSLTRTCYDPDEQDRACGSCDACQLRLKGFAANGIPDPIPYQSRD
jgi:7-cyano-7-deazaguanine synthase